MLLEIRTISGTKIVFFIWMYETIQIPKDISWFINDLKLIIGTNVKNHATSLFSYFQVNKSENTGFVLYLYWNNLINSSNSKLPYQYVIIDLRACLVDPWLTGRKDVNKLTEHHWNSMQKWSANSFVYIISSRFPTDQLKNTNRPITIVGPFIQNLRDNLVLMVLYVLIPVLIINICN